ncbi:hypothetical protein GCM10025787_16810 [Saccharopolyspora rosea]
MIAWTFAPASRAPASAACSARSDWESGRTEPPIPTTDTVMQPILPSFPPVARPPPPTEAQPRHGTTRRPTTTPHGGAAAPRHYPSPDHHPPRRRSRATALPVARRRQRSRYDLERGGGQNIEHFATCG